jgi:hypothetical protein
VLAIVRGTLFQRAIELQLFTIDQNL